MFSLENSLGIMAFILPMVIILTARGQFDARSNFTVLLGIVLIILAALLLHFLEIPTQFFSTFLRQHLTTGADIAKTKLATELWEFTIPVALVAFGVNLITEWFFARPAEPTQEQSTEYREIAKALRAAVDLFSRLEKLSASSASPTLPPPQSESHAPAIDIKIAQKNDYLAG